VTAEQTELSFAQPFVLVCAAVVAVLAVARITRLIIDDEYPPMLWLTARIANKLPEKWIKLVECAWCVSPYIAIADIAWGWASGLHWSWWLGNTWAALSQAAAMVNVRDIPPEDREQH
jgi:hypothetical protein